jgi:hypothetical protein
MKAKILGRFWQVRFVPNLASRGYCDPPDKAGKEILVWQGVKEDEELMEVLIHEFTHAADWHKDEEWVEQFGVDLARFLTRMGYKRCPQEKRS